MFCTFFSLIDFLFDQSEFAYRFHILNFFSGDREFIAKNPPFDPRTPLDNPRPVP